MASNVLVGGTDNNIHFVDDIGDTVKDQGGIDTIQTTLNSYSLPNLIPTSELYIDPITGMGGSIFYDNALEKLEFVGSGNF